MRILITLLLSSITAHAADNCKPPKWFQNAKKSERKVYAIGFGESSEANAAFEKAKTKMWESLILGTDDIPITPDDYPELKEVTTEKINSAMNKIFINTLRDLHIDRPYQIICGRYYSKARIKKREAGDAFRGISIIRELIFLDLAGYSNELTSHFAWFNWWHQQKIPMKSYERTHKRANKVIEKYKPKSKFGFATKKIFKNENSNFKSSIQSLYTIREKKNLQEVSFKVAKKNIEIKSLRKIALLDIKNKKATKTIKRLAKRNLAWAQYLFSQVYKTKKPNTYKSYILMASKNRYNLACNEIGKAYLIGNKIFPKNPKTALAYFGISADQDDPEGLFLRGKLLFQGDKEFQGNQTDGSKYIRKSAEKGYTPAKTFMESGAWKSWDKATDQPNGSTTKAETGSEQTDDTEQQQDASQKNEENESNQEEETIPTSTQNGRRG